LVSLFELTTSFNLLGAPHKIPTAPVKLRFPHPLLGEHTADILSELLSYDQGGVEGLRNLNVI
jgi:crotonobetainyl-CoA:carnitine CoA-transferase CaiB-like acyl-CoA transferase